MLRARRSIVEGVHVRRKPGPGFARRAALALASATLATLALPAPASATTVTFNYTGAAQTWTVPAGVRQATFDLYGAQGGGIPSNPLNLPGLGGRATATIPLTPGASIQVNVGGQGGIFGGVGGFNGGGNPTPNRGGGGGGASDIRIGGTALTDRVLVAGGGGGMGNDVCSAPPNPNFSAVGGHGGGLSGLNGGAACNGATFGGGGTQTAGGSAGQGASPGAFGVGGNGEVEEGGGGGGGWYGGGGGFIGGGGGGSGYGPPGTAFATGVRSGDGLVTVTYTEPSIANLIKSVVDLDLPLAAEATLLKPLIAAADGLDSGNVTRACTQLGLFIIDVHDLRGAGTIPAAAADQLVAEAEDVRDSLNCDATGVACAGQEATIVGTDSAETLRGTTGDDVIVAGGGGDTVVALGGDDLICGSGGNDEIRGKGGDDTLRGGSGKDELRGGGGSNRCRGGKGSDSKHHC